MGRPIRAESWRLPSNSAPFDASASQLAIAFAIASGRPKPASAAAYLATGKFLYGMVLPVCREISVAKSESV